MIVVEVATLSLLAGLVLPLLVGVVTKQVANPGLKATFLAGLSALAGVVTVAIDGGGWITNESLMSAVTTFVVAVATYYGFWKPTGVAETVQEKTKNLGAG